ncbi:MULTISPECIES: SusC/RagA family TonB-linked outer membrane protein [Aequorivita]|jgi:TonB-linked SusC/RagA family outer membrane protein|uniref:SusC/RagA family TonB-linked outer membrane protein n=2 Tax=Aequorivita TaxID=153265 RepID=A0AB35YZN0_9FLAO|nr:SusC/RagA family TonB-linked outer membrane protein [Aequorivita sp. Ant34-E75]WGF93958.1 SusC/RagA family TonB-linked outer membrane protein [Aequorivita sp. Ant34-E75]
MKTKFSGILTLLLVLVVQLAFAQEKTISGTVTDDTGLPLPGVNIIIKGTSTGTQSDFDGNYTIDAATGQTLVYSYVGFETQEIAVGASNKINVTMQAGSMLDEVVVTALGVSREKQSLGYSTQEVDGEDISTVKGNNFTNALSGKVSGLQIRRNNNLGGSTNVVIRGNTSLTGDNQALFVVDGVPISNRNTNDAAQAQARGNYYDYGNAAADINPDDIESVNVLKGAAASALYGSRAANGVIIITTKKGKKSKGIGVTINTNATVGFIDKSTFAEYQTQYGPGYGDYFTFEDINGDGIDDQVENYVDDASYGPAYDPNLFIYKWNSFDPSLPTYLQKSAYVAAANGPLNFFETPISLTNSISISNGLEGGSYRMSYTKLDQSGLMPNSQLDRHNFIFSGTYDVTEKLTASGFANYIKTDALGRNSTGYNDNVVGNMKQWWSVSTDVNEQKEAYFLTHRNVTWNPGSATPGAAPLYWDNPYWTRYENYQNDGRSRFIGNFELNYELADWVNVTGRVSTDTYSENQEERRAVGSVATSFGVSRGNVDSGYLRRDITATETNYDLMFNFNTDISENLSFAGILGSNIRRSEFNSLTSSTAGGLVVPGLYSLQNGASPLPNPVEQAEKIGVDGVYASASFGFANVVFLDGTVRRDRFSTLPKDNSAFYYPSVSTSFVFSKLLDVNAISFGKLRLNYAEVGNGAPFDRLRDTYVINGDIGNSIPNTANNPNLEPERTKSYEAGLEMRFANNRLGFDVSYYKSNSINQIVTVPISPTTGYTGKLLNAGEIENKGIEVSLNAMPIKNDNFTWSLSANWSQNKSEVLELPDGIKNLQLGRFQGGVSINAELGQPYGVIYGQDFVYLNGEKVVDPDSGRYLKTPVSNNVLGDTNPDWLAGITNTFTYKDLSFSFLIDIQEGGSLFSLDQYYGEATGIYANTAFTNDLGNPVRSPLDEGGGYINPGVNPDGSTNTTRTDANGFSGFGYAALPAAAFVYDASYIKLRQVSLSYNLPSKYLDNTFMTGLSFTLSGSNLWIINKNLPYADPEAGLSSGNLQGYVTGSLPTTQDYGFNIKAQF